MFLIVLALFVAPLRGGAQASQTKEIALKVQIKSPGDFADWPKLKQDIQFIGGKSTVSGLAKDQVVVLEDGIEQSDVTLQQVDQPASICLLLDMSSSMKENGKALIEAARRLIRAANQADEVAIIAFNGPVYVEQDFTTDTRKIDTALQRVEFKGASDVFDAVLASVVMMETHAPKYRKVIVILSDGDDNYSQVTLADLLRRLQYPGAPLIYSLSPPSSRDSGLRNLLALSKTTGGFTYAPGSLNLLNAQAVEISHDIRSRYNLEYTSTHTQRDGKLHKVEIRVTPGVSASKVKAYFRQEYYAPSH